MAHAFEILTGGASALLGPGYALSTVAIAATGALVAARQSHRAVLAGAASVVVLITALGARAGMIGAPTFSPLLALGPVLLFAELVRRPAGETPWWVGAVTGLLGGFLVVLWRAERFGPVLASLRGAWQQPPDRGELALYHLGSGLGLALVYVLGSALGRWVGDERTRPLRWGVWILAMLLVLLQRVDTVHAWLLLKWPAWRVG